MTRWPHPSIVWTGIILFCVTVWAIVLGGIAELINRLF